MVVKYPVDEKSPWYNGKFWPKGVPHQLDYNFDMTLGDMLNESAKKWPNDKAIWFLHSWVTYKELKDYVDKLATSLAAMGVKKGDVVAMVLPNCIQYVVGYYAAAVLGAVPSGVNPTYKAMEVLHQVKTINAEYILVLDALYADMVKPIVNEWKFKKVISTNIADLASGLSPIKKFLGKKLKKIPTGVVDHPNTVALLDLLKVTPNVPKVKINAAEDAATFMMSGGTTGVPKAVELTHQNVISNAKMCEVFLLNQKPPEGNLNLGHKTGMMGVLPLFHSFAMTTVMNSSILIGGWMVLFPRPPPTEELLHDITSLPNDNYFIYCAAEILFQRIAELPDEVLAKYDIASRLKLCVSGAGPLHDYVREPFERKTGAKIVEGYGLAEAGPVVSANNFFGERETGYIGVPFPGTDWKIFPSDDFSKGPIDKFGPEEGTGEICVAGPQVMKSYWNEPEQTADHIKDWGGKKWLLTGDIGFMEENGRIAIRDRKKQLIKMSGHSVFPTEVETLIGKNPKVLEVAVAGIPDQKLGEAVKAWVALRPEAKGTITTDELLAWCKDNMTHWKVPKYLEFIDEIPHNAIGKVMRRTLQEKDPLFIEGSKKK